MADPSTIPASSAVGLTGVKPETCAAIDTSHVRLGCARVGSMQRTL